MMDINEMQAGREMDVKIAELMGWIWITEDDDQPDQIPYLIDPDEDSYLVYYPKVAEKFPAVYPSQGLPPFSTDIAAAWLVVEKFLDQHDFDLNNLMDNDGEWMATIKPLNSDEYVMAKADTAPLAICRAALLARRGND
jgi:hypothetical protein